MKPAINEGTDLSGANLRWISLQEAILGGANLTQADITGSYILRTIFEGVDFHRVMGLEGLNQGIIPYK